MEFRLATMEDVVDILVIIGQAQAFLKSCGVNQWQNGYPNEKMLLDDINQGNSYVLENDNEIAGTAAVVFGTESSYKTIYEGQWVSDRPYATIHRVAVSSSNRGRGIASVLFNRIEEIVRDKGIKSIRLDTHEENKAMQKAVLKNNYSKCGIIYLADRARRIAFEKMLD
ncbi:MAG: GNAT family N-acetyltransferase [Christensenellales bacterium]